MPERSIKSNLSLIFIFSSRNFLFFQKNSRLSHKIFRLDKNTPGSKPVFQCPNIFCSIIRNGTPARIFQQEKWKNWSSFSHIFP